jgi:uncharacterized repeat protein (TIGR02059 family)
MTSSHPSARTEIIFVTNDIDGYEQLTLGFGPDAEVHVLDSNQDGLAQIAAALEGRSGLDAVHLFTHGASGQLQLGSVQLTESVLGAYGSQLAVLRNALSEQGDLLIYGCDVAAGDKGASFLAALSEATGADVAASNDPTGSGLLGGNWALEINTGVIDTQQALTPSGQLSYSGLLGIASENFDSLNLLITTGRESQLTANTWVFTASTPVNIAVADGIELPVWLNNDGGGSDRAVIMNFSTDGVTDPVVTGPVVYGIKSADGTNFQLNSFKIGQLVGSQSSVTVSAYSNGMLVAAGVTINLTASASAGNINYSFTTTDPDYGRYGTLSFNAAYNNVDEIRLSFAGTADLHIDDINVSTAVADTTPPAFSSATVNGAALVMTYTDAHYLNSSNTAAAGAFAVTADGGSITVNSVVVDAAAKTVTLTLDSAVAAAQVVTVAYTDPTAGNDANAIQDVEGNDAVTLGATAVTNNTPDTTPPVFASAAVDGNTLVMSYTEATTLNAVNTAGTGAFTVTAAGSAVAVTGVSVDANAKTVTLTLAAPVAHGQTVTVAYSDPTGGNDANAIQDAAGNDAVSLSATSVTNNTLDTTGPVVTSVSVPSDASYAAGQTLSFTVNFDENITVAGTDSELALTIGSTARAAAYASKTPTSITYTYTVQAGDNDGNGVAVGTLSLGTSTIRDAASNNATLTLNSVGSTTGVLVDTTAPSVSGNISVPSNGSYRVGQTLSFTVTLDENVTVTGSDSKLDLTIGSTARDASYVSKTGNSITYEYTVQAGDTDADGISVGSISLGSTTVLDAAGNAADLALSGHKPSTSAVLVDTAAPAVSGNITPPANGTYVVGETLSFTVTFDENMTVTGSGSTLDLAIGGTARSATYASKTANSITYTYTVQNGDSDTDGIAITGLTLNGDTIRDTAGNDASLALTGHMPALTGVLVDGAPPAVTGNISVPANDSYRAGQTLSFTVTFDENITVTGTDSVLGLTIGSTARDATFASKTANSVTYSYTVQAGDTDANGIAVGSITLGTTTIRDTGGNDAILTLSGHLPSTAGILADTTEPAVSSVSVPSNATYVAGQNLDFTVTFGENVTITGSDSVLGLTIGSMARSASFLSSTGSTVTYRYTVQAGDVDADGISVGALTLGGSTIRDAAGNDAVLTLNSVGSTTSVLIDGTVPSILGNITAPGNHTYVVGETLSFTVTFDEAVTVTGTNSTLDLTIGGTSRNATIGSTTANSITYTYTVQNGDNDADGIAVNGVTLNGDTIRDAAGNNASLILTSHLPALTGVLVDTAAPTFSAATVNGGTLVMTYADAGQLDAMHAPAGGAFTVMVAGSAVAVTGVAVNAAAKTATLTLATAVTNGQLVTVAYSDPSGGDDVNAIQDAAGNDAATLGATSVVNNTPAPSAPTDPTPPTTGTTVDGILVQTGSIVRSDGAIAQVVTIPVVTSSRQEQVGDNAVADIPLVKDTGGASLLTVQVPTGIGLQATGNSQPKAAGNSLTDLVREIQAHTTAGSQDQNQLTGGGSGFLTTLPADAPLLVQSIVPTVANSAAAPSQPLVITGTTPGANSVQTALVIDARRLPNGTGIELQNVEFAALIGAANVTGGNGSQRVWGDSASQNIFLGADDDILHGGGGDDTVGSAGGNDQIFGDEGNDLVFGGEGNDAIDGGTGTDTVRLVGSGRADYAFRMENGKLTMTHRNSGVDGTDTVANVEKLLFTSAEPDMTARSTITRMYDALFDRAPDQKGLDGWVKMSNAGMSMHDIANQFIGSNESKALFEGASNAQFVDSLYQKALGRTAAEAERSAWIGILDQGKADRADVLYAFANSAEKLALEKDNSVTQDFNRTDVATLVRLYDTLFDRKADQAGLNYWISASENGMAMTDIATSFIQIAEALPQFGGMSNTQFAEYLYKTGLGRQGSNAEIAAWAGQLDNGVISRGEALLGFAESVEKIGLVGVISTSIETS